MSFWNVVWAICIAFFAVAWLMVLFAIFADLFRDRDTSGWAKAVWVVALIFAPVVGAVVYIVVRGHQMSERTARGADETKAQQDAYIREMAGRASPADQIRIV